MLIIKKIKIPNLEKFVFRIVLRKKPFVTELELLETKKIKKEEFPITLEADADVTNGTIVKIFDIIRENGYSAVNLRTSDK
jgi:biopolymer transport protein ExbD